MATKKLDLSMFSGMAKQNEKKLSFALIFDPIDEEVAKQITQFIIENNFAEDEDRPDMLNILINSPGGNVTDALAIIDMIKSSHIPVRTVGLGQICSAALMIFLSGTKGQRILTPNTSIMSHRWHGGSIGKPQELLAAQKEFDLTSQRMMELYIKCTGLPQKTIEDHLLPMQDVYLTAEEALKFKLCDKVVTLY